MNIINRYRRPLSYGLMIGFIVIAALMIFADFHAVALRFETINLRFIPLILILAPLNYLLRYLKWNYFINLAGIKPEPRINRYIFMSGLGMTITPGKVGELLKCYLLKEHTGAPVSQTAPIVLAERVTDGLAMLILASIGFFAYPFGLYIIIVTAALMAALIIFFQSESLFNALTNSLSRIKLLEKVVIFSRDFYYSTRNLLSARSLLFTVSLGVISWSFEGLVVYLAMLALGGEISILGAFLVIGMSSLAGAISFLPGGLGAAEGSIMAILILLGSDKDLAAATTLITRFSTLWLGVAIGIFALFMVNKLIVKE